MVEPGDNGQNMVRRGRSGWGGGMSREGSLREGGWGGREIVGGPRELIKFNFRQEAEETKKDEGEVAE